jgi:hypothetical protein
MFGEVYIGQGSFVAGNTGLRNCPKRPYRAQTKALRADKMGREALFRRPTGAKSTVEATLCSLFGQFFSR